MMLVLPQAVDASVTATVTSRSPTIVRGRYGSRWLSVAIALTGILATMPYIALQLVGIREVIAALGIHGEWPLIVAFVILAAYTYTSGLRAPAAIAIVKDVMLYIMVIAAIDHHPGQAGRLRAHLRNSPRRRWPRTRRPASIFLQARRSTGATPRSPSARRWR